MRKLKSFTNILREQMLILYPKVPDSCKDASLRALAFIKVASILLECDDQWPLEIESKIKDVVEKEIALIYNGRQHRDVAIQESPIFDYSIDYNKFKIRWDETNEQKLRSYYQAMEWYSRCVFRSASLSETQSALLILMASIGENGEGINIWDEMNQLLTALYGEADDLHLQDYQMLAREVYGDVIMPSKITDKKLLLHFCRQAEKIKLPRIRSEVGLKGGLRIFGGRYYDREMILQQMCYPYVGEKGDPRVIPSLLDIAVILNQPQALEIAQERDVYRFTNYRTKIETYQATLQSQLNRTSTPWTMGGLVADAWIYQALMQPEGRGYPYFCKSDAWQSRKLTSLLCGVINLSDNKPKFTGIGEKNFAGSVEPYPEFFNRMLTMICNLERLLSLVGYPLNREPAKEILAYKKALKGVVDVSRKMLEGEALSQQDQDILGNFVLGWVSDFQEANINELSTMFHRNANQADYYFNAGVEPIREIWIVCPMGHISFLARGGVYMLYEFPTATKVLPEQWRKEESWKSVKKRGLDEVAPWLKKYENPNNENPNNE